MIETFGDFFEKLPEPDEYLTIGFSPSSAPLKKRWENNGLSADFIAEYFKTFFVSKMEVEGEEESIIADNLKDAVKYVANELLENAMKFQENNMSFTAKIGLSLYQDKLIFCVTNSISEQGREKFQAFIKGLQNEDLDELYLQAMKNNAKENGSTSGLGLLSMICDYSAKLGWKFKRQATPPITTVSTMVCLEASQPA